MATGNLSAARKPDFKGLNRFRGDWMQTSHWSNRQVKTAGQRIGVIGTGSSGVQAIPVLAREANHLYVFQRTPNYSVPANNGPIDRELHAAICTDVNGTWEKLISSRAGVTLEFGTRPAADYSEPERLRELERKWAIGGHGMNAVFSDQGINQAANDVVADFVRSKIRQIVKDPVVAQKLHPNYPIGARRLCLDTDYYATYNRDNVTLIDARDEAIMEITETGIYTTKNHYELDLIVFALGFHAFTGQIDRANVRNEHGRSPTDHWTRGPRTYVGIMTTGFPNFFVLIGPGSPSVLTNLFVGNEYHITQQSRI
jgi:cation diffusion facilitator CzcD-associated flavoprotein CzcO